jgi:uncharacterized membrane protein YphA (DoxX/SURF4 family)
MGQHTDTPRGISQILTTSWLWHAARVALVSAYLVGGATKLSDFTAAIAEQEHFGFYPGWLWAALTITVELGGSLLVISGQYVWLGAGGLGVLTAVAMLTANDFWTISGHDRFMEFNAFFEHLGLIAGCVLVSIQEAEARTG